MKYIKSKDLDKYDDNMIIYVNRNVLNTTIAKYEIELDEDCRDKLQTLLTIWKEIYKSEKETKRIMMFIEMPNKEIKRCFENYHTYPIGSFGVPQKLN